MKIEWKKILKSVLFGVIFGFVSFMISGDGSSVVVGLLVAYLEYRLIKNDQANSEKNKF